MNTCTVLSLLQVRPKPKASKIEPYSTPNKQTMLLSLEDFFHLSNKTSPSRYSSRKMKSSVTDDDSLPVGLTAPSTCSTEIFADVSLSSSSSSSSSDHSSNQRPFRRSSISVSEDGAEVVLLCERDSSFPLITPRKLSLLDMDLTPSPPQSMRSLDDCSPATPSKRVSFCGLGDCQSYSPMASDCISTCPSSDNGDDTTCMQHRISAVLSVPGDDDTWLDFWQAWGLGCDNLVKDDSTRRTNAKAVKKNIQRVLRNRAFDLNAKHQRLASLRKDLSPFALSMDMSSNLSEPIQAARSRSDAGRDRGRSKSTPRAATPEAKLPFLQRALQCGLGHDSPLYVKTDKEDVFYDSDPEDFICRQRRSQKCCSTDDKENVARVGGRTVSLRHDDQVATLVQEMMNEQLTLILHQNTALAKQVRSYGVHCWIERGQQLRSSIIVPKLFWKSIQKPATSASYLSAQPLTTANTLNSINLMDISRILPATAETVDRSQFPFCKPGHSLFIKTLNQSLLFETNSAADRDRIVKSLRLVVARLGSLLLTNNDRLADEYFAFVDQGNLGPGEEPYWMATV